jgi:hypothetical protein
MHCMFHNDAHMSFSFSHHGGLWVCRSPECDQYDPAVGSGWLMHPPVAFGIRDLEDLARAMGLLVAMPSAKVQMPSKPPMKAAPKGGCPHPFRLFMPDGSSRMVPCGRGACRVCGPARRLKVAEEFLLSVGLPVLWWGVAVDRTHNPPTSYRDSVESSTTPARTFDTLKRRIYKAGGAYLRIPLDGHDLVVTNVAVFDGMERGDLGESRLVPEPRRDFIGKALKNVRRGGRVTRGG